MISSDPGNLKAWQRRAEARKGKGNARGCVQDLDAALKLAPDSTAISLQLRQALPKYLNSKGLGMPSKRAAVQVIADLNDAEPDTSPQKQEKPRPSSQHAQPAVSNDKPEQDPAAKGEGACESEKATQPSQTDVCRSSTAEEPVQRDTGGANPSGRPSTVSEVQGASSKPGSAGGGSSRPSSAGASVKQAQVHLPSVETYVPSVAPVNSAEFERRWRAIRGDQAARSTYLDLVDPTSLVALFGNALTPDVLEGIVCTLLRAIKEEGKGERAERRARMMRELAQVKRFSMNLMLVAKAAKQTLAALWDDCINESCSDGIKEELIVVRKLYKL